MLKRMHNLNQKLAIRLRKNVFRKLIGNQLQKVLNMSTTITLGSLTFYCEL